MSWGASGWLVLCEAIPVEIIYFYLFGALVAMLAKQQALGALVW